MADCGAGSRLTVTSCVPAPSSALLAADAKDATGVEAVTSSLLRVSVADDTAAAEKPLTVIVSALLITASSNGVSVNDPVADCAPAGIVMMKVPTGVNPTTSGFLEPRAFTATVCAVPKRVCPCTVAITVTVVAPAPSEMVAGCTLSAIACGGASSSSTETVALPGEATPYPEPLLIVRVTESAVSEALSLMVGISIWAMPGDGRVRVCTPSSSAATAPPIWVTV